jgi:hypothetical protein
MLEMYYHVIKEIVMQIVCMIVLSIFRSSAALDSREIDIMFYPSMSVHRAGKTIYQKIIPDMLFEKYF